MLYVLQKEDIYLNNRFVATYSRMDCILYNSIHIVLFSFLLCYQTDSCGLLLGGCTSPINGGDSNAGLAEGGSSTAADLPPVKSTQCQVCFHPPHLTDSICIDLWAVTITRTVWGLQFNVFIWSLHIHQVFSYFQFHSPESINENLSPSSGDIQNCTATAPRSVYPCTSTVNPTIVLLQHKRGEIGSVHMFVSCSIAF